MFTVTMIHEADTRSGPKHDISFGDSFFSQLRHFPAQAFFISLARKAVGMVRDIADKINSPAFYRENLVIAFYRQTPLRLQVVIYENQHTMQNRFFSGKYDNIIGITVIIPHPGHLLDSVVEFRQIKISEVLGNVIADWYTRRTVDNAVKQPKNIGVFDFTAQN